MSKAKIHTVYKKANGMRVPSVTTILNELAKPALIPWAWKLGVQGIDYKTFRDELADVGSLAHKMILCHLKGETLCADDYTPNQVSLAENCFLKYLEWERQHKVETIAIEEPLVSEILGYGGTPDFFGRIDDLLSVMDFKSGRAIYDEHWYQLAAYAELLREKYAMTKGDGDIVSFRILNIGRDETENFDEKQKNSITREFLIFKAALEIYMLKKEINHERGA